jgi:tRNA pseudouridine65 synthase
MEKIEIIYSENDDWIIINKPAGLSVHNNEDESNVLNTLANEGYSGYAAVNRLDKETSGIMVLTKSSNQSAALQKVLGDANTKKKYFAILKGQLPAGGSKDSWEQALTKKAEGRKNPQGIKSERVECTTKFSVIHSTKYLSMALLELGSGRQHQIRKHAVLNKHQVIGDKRYGDRKFNTLISKKYGFKGMALHAAELKFTLNGKDYLFKADLPTSWQAFKFSL